MKIVFATEDKGNYRPVPSAADISFSRANHLVCIGFRRLRKVR